MYLGLPIFPGNSQYDQLKRIIDILGFFIYFKMNLKNLIRKINLQYFLKKFLAFNLIKI